MFEISDYDLLTMNTSDNRMDQTSVYNRNQGTIIVGFELVEWICMQKDVHLERFRVLSSFRQFLVYF